jgi:hypothetical protein
MACIYSGLKVRTFIQGEAVEKAVVQTEFPAWVEDRIAACRSYRFIDQGWTVERLP